MGGSIKGGCILPNGERERERGGGERDANASIEWKEGANASMGEEANTPFHLPPICSPAEEEEEVEVEDEVEEAAREAVLRVKSSS